MVKHKGRRQSHFANVPAPTLERSKFDRSHGVKTTFDAGLLIPIFVDEGLPGDTFHLRMGAFCRVATPIVPIMDNLYLESFFFAVPNRLLWENWVNFCGEQDDPFQPSFHVMPTLEAEVTGWKEHSMGDYFGIPINVPSIETQSLPFRAYNLIYNEWFRDENVSGKAIEHTGTGGTYDEYPLRNRGKRKDYFSSSLPWPSKGLPITIPLGESAPVVPNPNLPEPKFIFEGVPNQGLQYDNNDAFVYWEVGAPGTGIAAFDLQTGLQADLSNAEATSINEMRTAFQLQRLQERDARSGTRYTEVVKAHFNVDTPDARVQRPEFLGGGMQKITFTPVPQTSKTEAESPQGNLAAFATSFGQGHGFRASFSEHVIIIGLVSVRADLNYQQGLNRMWSRSSRFDHYWPALSHLGEQEVLSKEIYADSSAQDEDVWGYQERYAEYRYKPSMITGRFRSTSQFPLDVWHLAQEFGTRPLLNDAFIKEDPPLFRVLTVQTEPHFMMDAHFTLKCIRPMPTYSVPGMIDHF